MFIVIEHEDVQRSLKRKEHSVVKWDPNYEIKRKIVNFQMRDGRRQKTTSIITTRYRTVRERLGYVTQPSDITWFVSTYPAVTLVWRRWKDVTSRIEGETTKVTSRVKVVTTETLNVVTKQGWWSGKTIVVFTEFYTKQVHRNIDISKYDL